MKSVSEAVRDTIIEKKHMTKILNQKDLLSFMA